MNAPHAARPHTWRQQWHSHISRDRRQQLQQRHQGWCEIRCEARGKAHPLAPSSMCSWPAGTAKWHSCSTCTDRIMAMDESDSKKHAGDRTPPFQMQGHRSCMLCAASGCRYTMTAHHSRGTCLRWLPSPMVTLTPRISTAMAGAACVCGGSECPVAAAAHARVAMAGLWTRQRLHGALRLPDLPLLLALDSCAAAAGASISRCAWVACCCCLQKEAHIWRCMMAPCSALGSARSTIACAAVLAIRSGLRFWYVKTDTICLAAMQKYRHEPSKRWQSGGLVCRASCDVKLVYDARSCYRHSAEM